MKKQVLFYTIFALSIGFSSAPMAQNAAPSGMSGMDLLKQMEQAIPNQNGAKAEPKPAPLKSTVLKPAENAPMKSVTVAPKIQPPSAPKMVTNNKAPQPTEEVLTIETLKQEIVKQREQQIRNAQIAKQRAANAKKKAQQKRAQQKQALKTRAKQPKLEAKPTPVRMTPENEDFYFVAEKTPANLATPKAENKIEPTTSQVQRVYKQREKTDYQEIASTQGVTKDIALRIALDNAPPARSYSISEGSVFNGVPAFKVTFRTLDGGKDMFISSTDGTILNP